MTAKLKKVTKTEYIPVSLLFSLKVLAVISPKMLVRVLAKLFTTPMRHKMPKREFEMDKNSTQQRFKIRSINKEIVVYHYGNSPAKVLLVHGWSGRGTQLFKFAEKLAKQGYSTVSFDAPAHGKAPGKTSIMTEFIASIQEIDAQFGPFDAAIGHSLGGMSLLNSVKQGTRFKSLIVVGSGDVVNDIILMFIAKLRLPVRYAAKLTTYLEKISGKKMDTFSAYHGAAATQIPTLVIHDKHDFEVPVSCGQNIYKHLKNGKLIVTEGLGHRKILGDERAIKSTVKFIQSHNEKYISAPSQLTDNELHRTTIERT